MLYARLTVFPSVCVCRSTFSVHLNTLYFYLSIGLSVCLSDCLSVRLKSLLLQLKALVEREWRFRHFNVIAERCCSLVCLSFPLCVCLFHLYVHLNRLYKSKAKYLHIFIYLSDSLSTG
jgi:hypothetical protein